MKNKLCLASLLLLALPLSVSACGDDGAGADAPTADAAPGPDAADDGEWLSLVEGDWNLAANEEGYFCVIKTITEDVYIKAFKPISPLGTHHTVLTVYDGSTPDSTYKCSAGENGQSMIYGSGVGSPQFDFPPGVAVKLSAGQRVLINLHLFNTSDAPLTGHSGALMQLMPPSELEHEAEMVLAGPLQLSIPAGQTVTQSGGCTISNIIDEPVQVFAISSHMHQLGTHLKSTIVRGGVETVIQDVDYDFDEQTFQYVTPMIELRPGDFLRTECTYENTTKDPVTWGDSSKQEMCFTDIFYYPAQGATFICPF